MVHPFINIASFYLGWFACLLGATHNMPWLGVLVMAALLALHLFLTANRTQELRFILVTGLLGTSLDSLLMLGGLYTFTNHTLSWLCPIWMTALWMGFASTLNHSMRWLRGRYRLTCLFGAIGGPLSYYAGMGLGALSFVPSTMNHADGPCCGVEPRRSRPPAAGPHHVISGQPRRAVIASRR